jgi:hypothetical protein
LPGESLLRSSPEGATPSGRPMSGQKITARIPYRPGSTAISRTATAVPW